MAKAKSLPGGDRAGVFLAALARLGRFNRALSGWAAHIGFAALVFMVLLTCVDVLGAKLFLMPVPGGLDMMMLAQVLAITLAAAVTLIEQRHVAVEFFVAMLSRRVRRTLDFLVKLVTLALFVLIVWRLADYGYHLQGGEETTPTAHIPLAPFAYAAAVALVPVCLVLVQQVLVLLLGGEPDES